MTIRIWIEYEDGEKALHDYAADFETAQQVAFALKRLGYSKVWIELF